MVQALNGKFYLILGELQLSCVLYIMYTTDSSKYR